MSEAMTYPSGGEEEGGACLRLSGESGFEKDGKSFRASALGLSDPFRAAFLGPMQSRKAPLLEVDPPRELPMDGYYYMPPRDCWRICTTPRFANVLRDAVLKFRLDLSYNEPGVYHVTNKCVNNNNSVKGRRKRPRKKENGCPQDGQPNLVRLVNDYPKAGTELEAWVAEGRQVPCRVSLAAVTDPCHPCKANKWRLGTALDDMAKSLDFNEDLSKLDLSDAPGKKVDRCVVFKEPCEAGDLLGCVVAHFRTLEEDTDWVIGDMTSQRGMYHAFTHNVPWSEGWKTPLVAVGDSDLCLLSCVNDVTAWGICGRHLQQCHHCDHYNRRRPNAEVRHCIVKERVKDSSTEEHEHENRDASTDATPAAAAGSGGKFPCGEVCKDWQSAWYLDDNGFRYWPLVVYLANPPEASDAPLGPARVNVGDEVLLSWDEDGSFFKIIECNYKQAMYCRLVLAIKAYYKKLFEGVEQRCHELRRRQHHRSNIMDTYARKRVRRSRTSSKSTDADEDPPGSEPCTLTPVPTDSPDELAEDVDVINLCTSGGAGGAGERLTGKKGPIDQLKLGDGHAGNGTADGIEDGDDSDMDADLDFDPLMAVVASSFKNDPKTAEYILKALQDEQLPAVLSCLCCPQPHKRVASMSILKSLADRLGPTDATVSRAVQGGQATDDRLKRLQGRDEAQRVIISDAENPRQWVLREKVTEDEREVERGKRPRSLQGGDECPQASRGGASSTSSLMTVSRTEKVAASLGEDTEGVAMSSPRGERQRRSSTLLHSEKRRKIADNITRGTGRNDAPDLNSSLDEEEIIGAAAACADGGLCSSPSKSSSYGSAARFSMPLSCTSGGGRTARAAAGTREEEEDLRERASTDDGPDGRLDGELLRATLIMSHSSLVESRAGLECQLQSMREERDALVRNLKIDSDERQSASRRYYALRAGTNRDAEAFRSKIILLERDLGALTSFIRETCGEEALNAALRATERNQVKLGTAAALGASHPMALNLPRQEGLDPPRNGCSPPVHPTANSMLPQPDMDVVDLVSDGDDGSGSETEAAGSACSSPVPHGLLMKDGGGSGGGSGGTGERSGSADAFTTRPRVPPSTSRSHPVTSHSRRGNKAYDKAKLKKSAGAVPGQQLLAPDPGESSFSSQDGEVKRRARKATKKAAKKKKNRHGLDGTRLVSPTEAF